MGDVTCETCGAEGMSGRYPCANCDAFPVASDWSGTFQFDKALHGMRLGKRVRRAVWDNKSWSIEDGKLLARWPNHDEGEDDVTEASDLDPDDILAGDWEVASA